MRKKILKRSLSYIVVASLLVLMSHSSAVANPPVIKKLVINPSTTEIPTGAKKISIVAKTSGGDGQELRYQWKHEGPGDLEEPTTNQEVYYIPPATIEPGHNLATVSVTVWEEGNEEQGDTAAVILTLIGIEVNINSHKGDLAQKLSGKGVVILTRSKKTVIGDGTRFTEELKPGDAIKIGKESPERGENVFVVASIKDDEELELDQEHPTGVQNITPMFRDQELFVVANGAEDRKMVIDNSGNVGIGTTDPKTTLEVHHSAQKGAKPGDEIGLKLVSADHQPGGVIYGYDLNHSIFFRIGRDGSANVTDYHQVGSHRFFTGGNLEAQKERMKISRDGKIYIGTKELKVTLDVNGDILQRGKDILADYVFELGYDLESIEEHAVFMQQEKHLKALPQAQKDEQGQDMIEYGAHLRGMLEELEKAHVYIVQLNELIKEQQETISALSQKVEALEKEVK